MFFEIWCVLVMPSKYLVPFLSSQRQNRLTI